MSTAARSRRAPGVPGKAGRPGKTGKAGQAGRAGQAGLKTLAALGLLGAMAVMAPAVCVILVVGMAPSLVAGLVEGAGRLGGVTALAAMNLAGVLPVVALLWQQGARFQTALQLLGDVYLWALMYGGAGLALLLLWGAPLGAKVMLDLYAREHRAGLVKAREKLRHEWGKDIVNDATGEAPRLK